MENRHELDARRLPGTAAGAGRSGPVAVLRIELAAGESAAIAPLRARLRAALGEWGLAHLADTAELLATELAGNALRHTAAGAVFTARQGGPGRLRVEVADASPGLPRPRTGAAELETSGRGMLLVEALAAQWGVRLTGGGKVTWFELVE
jgi:anti-sigma regulatory factor (Ser/Thr protein kinase)